MIIRRMQATFGKLDGAVLTPQPGLNIICSPNESGKTTWGAFLTAMLYGVDTRERTTKDALAVKDRYRPWSGKPMEGTLEVIHNGRSITIQRQSRGRTPMGVFRAWDTDTGETIEELTAENCGQLLLGVEKSVFVRSAFIGQGAMAVSRDAGLEQRLSSLVTTGDETVSFTKTADTLHRWKNHVRHNHTGLLPDTEQLLRQTEDKLQAIRAYHRQDLDLHIRRQSLEEEKTRLSHIERCLAAAENHRKRQQLDTAEDAVRDAESAVVSAREEVRCLPDLQTLTALQQQLDTLTAPAPEETLTPPQEPGIPAHFRGLTPEQLHERAEADADELRRLQREKQLPPYWIAALVLALASLGLMLLSPWWGLGLLPALALGVCFLAAKKRVAARNAANRQTAGKLLADWESSTADAVLLTAARWGEALRRFREDSARYEEALLARQEAKQAFAAAENTLFAAVRAFAMNIYTLDDAAAALTGAIRSHRSFAEAEAALSHKKTTLAAIRAAVGEIPQTDAPAEDFSETHSLPQVRRELAAAEQGLRELDRGLALQQGSVQALGDPAVLEAQRQQLTEKQTALTRRFAALELAEAVLQEANAELRSQFSPQLTQTAAGLFSTMTGGKYDALRIPEDLSMEVRQPGEAAAREGAYLSGGTRDQLYLALRLAICRLALGEDVPLILDDALVYFDDARHAQAMTLLEEESKTRQILLFTCRR